MYLCKFMIATMLCPNLQDISVHVGYSKALGVFKILAVDLSYCLVTGSQ